MSTRKQDRVDVFHARGFFVAAAFLGARERDELRLACDAALRDVRATARETGHSTPRISLLADCDLAVAERVVAFFSSPRLRALLDGVALPEERDPPVLRDVHYYHEQTRRDWDGDWHRDSQFGRPDPEIERGVIRTTTTVHVRVALEPDDRLEIVPGSHARWDTAEELRIRKGAQRATDAMPNAARITLAAGDACVFHAWSVHRATYRRAPLRRTLDAVYAFSHPKNTPRFG